MQVLETIAALRTARRALRGTVGLVPTMGYLHRGHIALVEQAARENDQVIVTIFVNPTQFGANEDFSRYPRDPEHDLELLRAANVSLLFMPFVPEMYPTGFQTAIEVNGVSQGLEGERRPGHFRGVATVVGKLFNLTQPDRAYFGQKDAQQVAVIRRMTVDLAFPLEIMVGQTIREADGLAMSSRNMYLSPAERAAASVLYRALSAAQSQYQSGLYDADKLRQIMRTVLATEPLAEVDYVSAADADTLQEIEDVSMRPMLLSMAVRIGRTRLIDNVRLDAARSVEQSQEKQDNYRADE